MIDADSTIAAIATATGGAIGIVRISGRAAEAIAARLVRPWPAMVESHRLYLGAVHDAGGARLDEVLVTVMRAPRSFTGETCVELQAHGGKRGLEAILAAVLAAGARRATAGEFTRRAFTAGRIDLTRAEAIAALIGAESEAALAAARAMQAGELARTVAAARTQIVEALADLEGALDFPDEDLAPPSPATIAARLHAAAGALAPLVAGYRAQVWRAAEVILVGQSNAGKSSLFNALCGEERALVDAEPGTTRDLVSAPLSVEEWSITLTDSAGLREQPGRLEERGIALVRERLQRADLALLVLDGPAGWTEADARLWAELPRRKLLVWNKIDCSALAAGAVPDPASVLPASATRGDGVPAIRAAIAAALRDGVPSGVVAVSERQAEALRIAVAHLQDAATELDGAGPEEVAAVAARRALATLGQVTGETADREILDAVFSRFCIGK